jgi:hypothetical protein
VANVQRAHGGGGARSPASCRRSRRNHNCRSLTAFGMTVVGIPGVWWGMNPDNEEGWRMAMDRLDRLLADE